MSFTDFHGWIVQHPDFAGLAVFAIALTESLAVVGLVVPGVAMMFAAGALIGSGALEFAPICAYAVAGAVAGDGLSFWVGWHYRRRLLSLWPFIRYPGLINTGMAFFRRYGGRSVLFGRFVGPVRAVIPLVAGMLAMPVGRFLAFNLASALLWGPAYLLPGMAVGASVELASQVAGRLAVLLLVLLVLLWLTGWLGKRLYAYFQPRAHGLILWTFDLCRAHPGFGRLAAPLIDSGRADYAGLLAWAAILGAFGGAASALLPADPPPVSPGAWRNPWADTALAVFEALGKTSGVLVFSAAIAAWLLLRGQRLGAGHLLVGVGCALLPGALGEVGFAPLRLDGPVLAAAAAYGFTAVLLAGRAPDGWHWPNYAAAVLLVATIAFARFYFGADGFVALGLTLVLAMAWLLLLGVAYRRHSHREPPARGLAWVALLTLAGLAGGLALRQPPERFEDPSPVIALSREEWLERGWSRLPAGRTEAFGQPRQLLAIQWATPLAALRDHLERNGWREAKPFDPGSALRLLSPDAGLAQLPVLPRFNQANVDVLRMIKPVQDRRWLIVRFWPSGFELEPGAVPIWLGSVAFLEAQERLGWLRFAGETADAFEPLNLFVAEWRSRLRSSVRTLSEGPGLFLIPPE